MNLADWGKNRSPELLASIDLEGRRMYLGLPFNLQVHTPILWELAVVRYEWSLKNSKLISE